jgi:hypothetical protein
MTNKIDKEDKENGLVLSRPYKSILLYAQVLTVLPSITDISLQNRTSNHVNKLCGCLWMRGRGSGGGHHSHNNTTNVTAKVNWNQRPPEHHEG